MKLFRLFTLLSLCFLLPNVAIFAQKGFKIQVKIDNYPSDSLVLGFHYGEKQYVKDTVTLDKDGMFTFSADTLLPCGVYLLVLQPNNDFVQFLLPEYDQQLSMHFAAGDFVPSMKIKGSEDNDIFYKYMQYLGKVRPEADTLRAEFMEKKANSADSVRLIKALDVLDVQVKNYQTDLVIKNPTKLVAKIINAAIEPKIPEFTGDEREQSLKRYHWYREHYFDNIAVEDPCMLRTPIIHGKVDYFISKLAPQHPDSINQTLDNFLKKVEKSPETYKYYLIHYLNEYAKSKIVGMDACYVHLARNYYCKGKAPWTSEEDLAKICENADRLEPILIGKKAPDIMMLDKDNKNVNLYSVKSPYTVLVFWDPECGHCKKSAPDVVKFWNQYKDKNIVKIFSVCTAVTEKAADCVKSVEEKEFNDFINVTDPYIRSRYKTLYDIRSTPQIFILDENKNILIKKIGAEQLIDVMEDVIRVEENKKRDGIKR